MAALDMDTWNRIQKDARDGKWGDFATLRQAIWDAHSAAHPDEGIGSSDLNHIIFGLFQNNEDCTPEDALIAVAERF